MIGRASEVLAQHGGPELGAGRLGERVVLRDREQCPDLHPCHVRRHGFTVDGPTVDGEFSRCAGGSGSRIVHGMITTHTTSVPEIAFGRGAADPAHSIVTFGGGNS